MASGIVAVLGSVLTLLGLSLGLVRLLIAPMPPNAQMPAGIWVMAPAMLFMFIACAVLRNCYQSGPSPPAELGADLSVGLVWNHRFLRWICSFAFFVIPMPTPRDAPDFTIYLVRVFLFLIYGLPCAIGVWWLVPFKRKPIVAQFTASSPEPLPPVSALSLYRSRPAAPARPGLPVPVAVFAPIW
jgi:hypothetical protein